MTAAECYHADLEKLWYESHLECCRLRGMLEAERERQARLYKLLGKAADELQAERDNLRQTA